MPHFRNGEIDFHYTDEGEGSPWVFLHGMGSDMTQPITTFSQVKNVRFITMDFRGHGGTPFSSPSDFTLAQFADDVLALLEYLGINSFGLGGISLGSAVSMNIASRFPERIKQLIFCRPAWLVNANGINLEVSKIIGNIFKEFGEEKAESQFRSSQIYHDLESQAPGCLQSIAGQLGKPHASIGFEAFTNLVKDQPVNSLDQFGEMDKKALIMGNLADPIHPIAMAKELTELLPKAEFKELPKRYLYPEEHYREAGRLVAEFIEGNH